MEIWGVQKHPTPLRQTTVYELEVLFPDTLQCYFLTLLQWVHVPLCQQLLFTLHICKCVGFHKVNCILFSFGWPTWSGWWIKYQRHVLGEVNVEVCTPVQWVPVRWSSVLSQGSHFLEEKVRYMYPTSDSQPTIFCVCVLDTLPTGQHRGAKTSVAVYLQRTWVCRSIMYVW